MIKEPNTFGNTGYNPLQYHSDFDYMLCTALRSDCPDEVYAAIMGYDPEREGDMEKFYQSSTGKALQHQDMQSVMPDVCQSLLPMSRNTESIDFFAKYPAFTPRTREEIMNQDGFTKPFVIPENPLCTANNADKRRYVNQTAKYLAESLGDFTSVPPSGDKTGDRTGDVIVFMSDTDDKTGLKTYYIAGKDMPDIVIPAFVKPDTETFELDMKPHMIASPKLYEMMREAMMALSVTADDKYERDLAGVIGRGEKFCPNDRYAAMLLALQTEAMTNYKSSFDTLRLALKDSITEEGMKLLRYTKTWLAKVLAQLDEKSSENGLYRMNLIRTLARDAATGLLASHSHIRCENGFWHTDDISDAAGIRLPEKSGKLIQYDLTGIDEKGITLSYTVKDEEWKQLMDGEVMISYDRFDDFSFLVFQNQKQMRNQARPLVFPEREV